MTEVDQKNNPQISQPIYKQLAYSLEEMLAKDYQPGEYLPSENELAAHFGVNRHTVRRAMDDLVASGLILRKQGKGALIVNTHIEYSLSQGKFTATLDKLRKKSQSEVIKSDVVSCNAKVADYLGIEESQTVIIIETLRHVDDQPMSIITHFLNPEHVPDINDIYLGGSLHQCIEKNYGLTLVRSSALISAVMPTHDDAFYLKSALGQPLLKVKSFNTIQGDQKKIVEVSISRSRSDRFQIKV
jgi:GntR family phosphonate transport system transcriptional regulator